MDENTNGVKLRIYIAESDRWEGKNLYKAIVFEARELKLAEADRSCGFFKKISISSCRLFKKPLNKAW